MNSTFIHKIANTSPHPVGEHHLIEFNGCDRLVIDSENLLRSGMLAAVAGSGASIIKDIFHSFSPYGVTGVVVIAESHVSIHTWPELNYAAVDIFTCGTKMDVPFLVEKLRRLTCAKATVQYKLARGPMAEASAFSSIGTCQVTP